jgi:retron-type reverse transcriptase
MTLIEEILTKENLNQAYLKVYRNKGSAGVDGVTVEELKAYLKTNGKKLVEDIKKRRYRPHPVKRVEIPKGDGKIRQLGIPTVVDRVIQSSLVSLVTDLDQDVHVKWQSSKV